MPSQPPAAPSILVSTLGTEPQVVTAVLDLLRLRGERVLRAVVLHTVSPDPAVQAAVQTLRVLDSPIPIRLIPLTDENGQPLADVTIPNEIQSGFRGLYTALLGAKREAGRVHLCISGGRKSLAVFGLAAAQLVCDEQDHLWMLHSGRDFLASRRLHPATGEDAQLVEIPLLQGSLVAPILLDPPDDPLTAYDSLRAQQLRERLSIARQFVTLCLTRAEARVTSLLVSEGLGDAEIASRLSLSPRTIEQHLRSTYQKAAAHWGLPNAGRATLIALLNLYYSLIA